MADAKPVRVGVATETQEPRNTGRPVRAGLVQEKKADGTPADVKKKTPRKKKAAAKETDPSA